MASIPTGNPNGRPSLYDPKYCQTAIDFMGKGYSLTALAGHLGLAKQTLYDWMAAYPEFLDSINKARTARVMALEVGMLETESAAKVNARKFALINADKHEWRLTQSTDNNHTAKVVYLHDSDKAL